jgi:hypothetical protein
VLISSQNGVVLGPKGHMIIGPTCRTFMVIALATASAAAAGRRPVSSATAESAVNQVVSKRMAKKQRMRYADFGITHLIPMGVPANDNATSLRRPAVEPGRPAPPRVAPDPTPRTTY